MDSPKPVIFAGPSGVGKSSLIKLVQKDWPDAFGFSVSHTTRKPRPGEADGVNYWFTDVPTFEKIKSENKFIETATFAGNLYGTSFEAVSSVAKSGRICILDIDLQGVLSFKALKQDTSSVPYFLFFVPPSMEELERRLKARGDTPPDAMEKRLETAKRELLYRDKPDFWDHVFVNDKLDETHVQLKRWFEDHYPALKKT